MKKIIFCFAIILTVSSLKAQRVQDVVYLKNGSIIRGTIVEQNDASVKIESEGKNVWVFNKSEVEKITEEEKPDKRFTLNESGYFNKTDLGALMNYESYPSPSFLMVNGYKFKFGLAVGIGTGFDLLRQFKMPIFVDATYLILDQKRFTPFVYCQLGYAKPFNLSYYSTYKGGIYFNGGVGIINFVSKNVGFMFSVGYSHQSYTEEYNDDWYYNNYSMKYIFNRANIRIGLVLR